MTVSVAFFQNGEGADLLSAFREICEAKAILWANHRVELPNAVDDLQEWAEKRGLVAAIGQDAVQETIAAPFAWARAEPDENFGEPFTWPTASHDAVETEAVEDFPSDYAAQLTRQWEMDDPRDAWRHTGEAPQPNAFRNADLAGAQAPGREPYRTPQSVVAAFWCVVQQEDADRLAEWLADHPRDVSYLNQIWGAKCSIAAA